jgi:hypothetical protein
MPRLRLSPLPPANRKRVTLPNGDEIVQESMQTDEDFEDVAKRRTTGSPVIAELSKMMSEVFESIEKES